jgi:hypothetical protein
VVLALGAGAVCGASVACVGSPTTPPPWSHPEVRRVWPREPERPRIEYLGVIRSAADLGGKIGPWQRLKRVLFGEEQTAMVKPISVAKNAAGVLVVADPSLPVVHWFDLERRKYRRIGDEPPSLLRSPVGVAIDDAGRVYVADSARSRVFVFDEDRRLIAELGEADLVRPTGLALDPAQEHLYVVDTTACRVAVFDLAGHEVGSFGRSTRPSRTCRSSTRMAPCSCRSGDRGPAPGSSPCRAGCSWTRPIPSGWPIRSIGASRCSDCWRIEWWSCVRLRTY